MTLQLTCKNFLSWVVGACVVGLAIIPILVATDHLGWLRWQIFVVILAVVALAALFAQIAIQSNEDRERDKNDKLRDARFTSMEECLQSIAKGSPLPLVTDTIKDADVVIPSSREQLQLAQEAVFVEELLAKPTDDLKVSLAHDREFLQKYEAIPEGKYPKLDAARKLIAKEPIIAAKYVRAHLMPRSPFIGMIRDVFRAAGKTDFETTSDFLFEVHAVNITDNVTTIQKVTAEAEIDGTWVALPQLDDLSHYELAFYDKEDSDAWPTYKNPKKVEQLSSFSDKVKGAPLQRGVGYEGWIGFELASKNSTTEKSINHKV